MKDINLPTILEKPMHTTLDKHPASKRARLLAYYEEAGPDYSTWSKKFNMHFGYYDWGMNPFNREAMLEKMTDRVLDRLKFNDGQNGYLGDFGCGLGATLRYAARRFQNLQFKGVTLVPWQISQATTLNDQCGLSDRISLLEEDYTRTSFEDNSLDGVVAIESSCYARGQSKSDLLSEIHRVLKPGGRFVIADGFRKNDRPLPGILNHAYELLCQSWALTELGNVDAFKSSAQQIGFKDLEVTDISWKVAVSVAHVPFTVLAFLIRQLLLDDRKMTPERWNNLKSPLLTMIIGLARRDFGYYLVSGTK